MHWKIVHRTKEGVESDIDTLLGERLHKLGLAIEDRRRCPARCRGVTRRAARGRVDVLNDVLLPAMKEVGDLFGAGELILPFVLQSAEVMKKAVAHLELYLDKLDGATKGKVVLATVYGDVHDIGKNLVNTILSNNGYTVYDLGKQVPLNTIIEKAIEVGADAIGLSALLVEHIQADAAVRAGAVSPRAALPGAGGRSGDQPAVWPTDFVRRRRAAVRAGRVLLQRRVRRA